MKSFPATQPELSTQNLKLRALSVDDIDAFMAIAMRRGKFVETKEKALEILTNLETDYISGRTFTWGIFFENKLIGTCGYYRGFNNNSGEVGYAMHQDYRRKGYMFEALLAVINFGKTFFELKQVTAFTKIENNASVSLLKKLHFKQTNVIDDDYTKFLYIF